MVIADLVRADQRRLTRDEQFLLSKPAGSPSRHGTALESVDISNAPASQS